MIHGRPQSVPNPTRGPYADLVHTSAGLMLQRRSSSFIVALALVFGQACGSGSETPDAPDAAPASTPDTAPPTESEAPLWSEDGLEAQLRVAWLRDRIPPELGFTPGTTPWRSLAEDPEDGFAETVGHSDPVDLLVEIGRAFGVGGELGREFWEQTSRIHYLDEGAAVGVVLRWGLQDDSVAGHDLRVRMVESNGAWRVERIEERFHCSRGVTDSGLCL